MSAKARRRRGSGSLGQLKGYFWAAVCYELSVIENPEQPHETRHKAVNGLVQAGLAYMKSIELTDLEARLSRLEERLALGEMSHNGHP